MEKMMKQKKVWIVAVAGVVLLAVLIAVTAVLGSRKEPSYRSIKIVELEGNVSIDRGGVGTLAAAQNMNLISGDRVSTSEKAYVVLCLDTDKYVMLGEAGAMRVVAEGDGKSGKTSISLESGSVLNDIRNPLSEGSSYEIATPNATMSVRGTVFEVRKVSAGEGRISVLVYDGSVAVGLGGKEPVLYGAGEYTVFTDSAAPKVIVERGTVSDDVIDEKVRERLRQISEEGRALNVGSADLNAEATATPAPAATPEATATPAPTAMPEATATPAPTATPEATATPAPTATPEATATPALTATPEATATPAPTATPMATATPVATATPAPTATPAATATPAPTATPVVTATPVPAVTPVPELEEEDEEEPEEEDFEEPVSTVEPTHEPTPIPKPTPVPTSEPEPAPTHTPGPTWGPWPTWIPWWPTAAPTIEPTAAPTATPTVAPTIGPTAPPTAVPTIGPTAAPTAAPTIGPTIEPTAAPTATPTIGPTVAPTAAPTIGPTAAPTATPTIEPTVAPTAIPTIEPTAAPTTAPTATPVPPQEGYCSISYKIPYVLLSGKEPENAGEAEGILTALAYGSSSVKKGELLDWKQGEAEVTSIPNHGDVQSLGFEFVGWYKANGFEWNFATDAVMEDTVLYPVWKDKDGNLYKVKVSEELGICYSMKEQPTSSPSPSPAPSEEPTGSPSPAPSSEPAGES